jgi:hypothetical protein
MNAHVCETATYSVRHYLFPGQWFTFYTGLQAGTNVTVAEDK